MLVIFSCFCFHLMICCFFFKINFFQEHHQSFKQFGSRSGPTFCGSQSGSKQLATVISKRHKSSLARKKADLLLKPKKDFNRIIDKIRPLVKCVQKNNYLISQPKHMLWVLKKAQLAYNYTLVLAAEPGFILFQKHYRYRSADF